MTTNNIASERIRLGLKQSELGERLGVSTNSVCQWELGAIIKSTNLIHLAKIFGCSTDYLLGLSNERLAKSGDRDV